MQISWLIFYFIRGGGGDYFACDEWHNKMTLVLRCALDQYVLHKRWVWYTVAVHVYIWIGVPVLVCPCVCVYLSFCTQGYPYSCSPCTEIYELHATNGLYFNCLSNGTASNFHPNQLLKHRFASHFCFWIRFENSIVSHWSSMKSESLKRFVHKSQSKLIWEFVEQVRCQYILWAIKAI